MRGGANEGGSHDVTPFRRPKHMKFLINLPMVVDLGARALGVGFGRVGA
jgi:hypothetical protein